MSPLSAVYNLTSNEKTESQDTFFIDTINAEGLFLPGEDPAATDRLLETVWKNRETAFLVMTLRIKKMFPDLVGDTGFDLACAFYNKLDGHNRRQLMEHPVLRIWLRHTLRLPALKLQGETDEGQKVALGQSLHDFFRLTLGADSLVRKDAAKEPYEFLRFDVDPLLAGAIPPSYVFERLEEKKSLYTYFPYGLDFAQEVIEAGLRRITLVWPEMGEMFPKFVRTIVHLPDLEARSCSAQRFAGAILLSAEDSLLAIEESLVHECGHQVLYCLMEVDPLIKSDARTFKLPWSGSERDAYGYFHATYIYVMLAMYFEKAVALPDFPDVEEAKNRLTAILSGLEKALPDFEAVDFFTPVGAEFFRRLSKYGKRMIARNKYKSNSVKKP